ncbi:nose resistant to fluoxetine protein 6-like [Tachypleus tridentatus]|uniref:nose resistant to fluoxetine protein 6-like n=1 Tax=Tachypleus tridentatus TaxID=6853 RepID=UPI003FD468C7
MIAQSSNFTVHCTSLAAFDSWKSLQLKTESLMLKVTEMISPYIRQLITTNGVSQLCQNDINMLLEGLKHSKTWAVQMMDATGKIPSGILRGSLTALGDFDQCLNINVNTSNLSFRGKYCSVEFKPLMPPSPRMLQKIQPLFDNFTSSDKFFHELTNNINFFYILSYRVGICVPSSCLQEEVYKVAQKVASQIHVKASVIDCNVRETLELRKDQIIVIMFLLVVGMILVFATIADVCTSLPNNEKRVEDIRRTIGFRCLQSFSVYSNAKKILTTRSSNTLRPLHGIRFISTLWVILGHTLFYTSFQLFNEVFRVRKLLGLVLVQPLKHGTVVMETFFTLGGFLSFYLTFKELSRRSYSSILFIFFRWMRLSPPLVFLLCLTMLIPLLDSGPLWNEKMEQYSDDVRDNWWRYVFLICNLRDQSSILSYTWYIGTDFQINILSAFVITLLFRSPKKGLSVILVVVLVSSVVTGVVTEYFKFPAARYFTNIQSRELGKLINFVYVQPYRHLGSYFVGAVTGYLVVKRPVIKLSKVQQLFGWLFFTLIIVGVLFGTIPWTNGEETGRVAMVLYAALYPTFWALALAWLIVACLNGYGGIINTFLSSSYFIRLDRLSYAVYLLHIPVYMSYFYQKKHTTSYQEVELAYMFFGTVMVVYPLAFLFTVFFESPFIALLKTIFTKPREGDSSDLCIIQNFKEEKTLLFKTAHTNKSI